ncbi:hypothetical protein ACQ4PT_052843 [Festuca glaucescens]
MILRVLGAQSRGELEELVSRTAGDVLKDRSESSGPSVAFVCGVWSDLTLTLKPAFRRAVVGTYKAEASSVDFRHAPEEARDQMNAWAAQKTRNLIDSVLPPGSIKPTTPVVLGNAVYFNGAWEDEPFDKRDTVHKPFHRLDGSHVDVPFMQSRRKQFVAVHDGFKVLKLQYKMVAKDRDDPYGHPHVAARVNHTNVLAPRRRPRESSYAATPQCDVDPSQFSMCIFLPDALDGLQGLLHTIASKPGFLQHHLPQCRVDVGEIRVPKFKLSFHKSVVTVLEKLGLKLPFSTQADLSDMVEDDGYGLPIVVGDIIHKAVIEVNEEGTEAAAVTMVITKLGHSRTPRHPMASPQCVHRSPSSASQAAPAFSTANFVRSLRKAASFGYRKTGAAGVVDAVGTTRRHGADAAVMSSPCRSSPEPRYATRRRRSTGEPEDVGRRSAVPGKMATTRSSREEDAAHRARVLTARLLQWRFTNARLEKAMARATSAAQKKLFYAWLRVAELRNIHAAKMIVAQRWRQKVKLGRLLRTQLPLLGTWEPVGGSHAGAVAELGRVLSAAAASLPLTDGAQTRLQLLHETMLACVRAMDEIEANAAMFYATGGVTSSAAGELASTIRQEIAGLDEAMRLSRILASFLVQEASLRADLVQAKRKID